MQGFVAIPWLACVSATADIASQCFGNCGDDYQYPLAEVSKNGLDEVFTKKDASFVRRQTYKDSIRAFAMFQFSCSKDPAYCMNDIAHQSGAGNPRSNQADRFVQRDGSATAPGRCLMYALFSDIAASPFDAEPVVASQPFDLDSVGLPYELSGFEGLFDEWRETDKDTLKRDYSGLFEVGSKGPPVPIREDLHRNQPAGVREDIVRFYEFFGYGLDEKFAWSPDHLSIELEFMHFLCYQEAEHSKADDGDALSFQLAQSDFSERHLVNWVSELAERVNQQQPGCLYGRLLAAMSEFLVKDFEWQASTIETTQ